MGAHPVVYSVVVILAIGLSAFFLAIVPFVRMLQPGGSASVSDARTKNESAKALLDSQKKIVSSIAAIPQADRDLLAYALPSEADTPGLSVQLNSIAVNSGVKLTRLDMTAAIEATGSGSLIPQSVQPINIVMSVDGISYDKLKILLSNIDNSLRLLDVRTLSFTPGANSISLELRTYFINPS